MNGPAVIAYPHARGFRLRGPEAVAVARALGIGLTIPAPALDDVRAYCQAAHLLLVVARDRTDRRT
jgi:hypothetical protein